MEESVKLETLVIAFNVFISLLGGGTLWKLFGLASHAGRIEQKVEHLEENAREAKTQIATLSAQVNSLNSLVLAKLGALFKDS
jgi:hypothetical protein